MKKCCLTISILFIVMTSLRSYATGQSNVENANTGVLLFGVFHNEDIDKSGIELSGIFTLNSNAYFEQHLKVSGVLYEENSEFDEEDTFGGFSAAWHISHKSIFNPYVAMGLFGGETFNCDDVASLDYCEEDFIYSIYPEFGLTFKVKDFQISPFVRRYFDFEGNNAARNVYGISLGVKF